jgi:hypothetical protein
LMAAESEDIEIASAFPGSGMDLECYPDAREISITLLWSAG